MVSVASRGTADRIAARIFFKALRAESGTPAAYSSKFLGGALRSFAERRLMDFAFLTRAVYQATRKLLIGRINSPRAGFRSQRLPASRRRSSPDQPSTPFGSGS